MNSIDALRYDGRRALVVGGATGMGEAAARILLDLGAEVLVIDVKEIETEGVKAIHGDLRDKQSIDDALAQVGGPIDALLSCAGVADGDSGIEKANFIGHRHVIDRLFATNSLPRGSAIGMISSVAGVRWRENLPQLQEFLATPDYDSASAWIDAHEGTATYGFTKQAMCAYVAQQAYPFLQRGVRINALMPGPTNTPLARANGEAWLGFARDYRESCGIESSTPEEQAYVLVFLCSRAASYANGVHFINDAGYVSSGVTGTFESPTLTYMLNGG
jgi:NAD(P)-dependent dehydrogenase (short-subunit alcohol dehydrogenase family)